MKPNRKWYKRESGHAIVEFALMTPWIFYLFIGVLDFGFVAHGMIATENAARVAAMYTAGSTDSATDIDGACQMVLAELQKMPNVGSGVANCSSAPVQVTAQSVTGLDGSPAARVTVTYQSMMLIPIPGLLSGQFTTTRYAEFRVREP